MGKPEKIEELLNLLVEQIGWEKCSECDGKGECLYEDWPWMVECKKCDGKRYVEKEEMQNE